MLCFEDTKLLASCLSRLPLPSLILMACHPSGSHIFEAFLSSRTVDGKRKEKVKKKLKVSFKSPDSTWDGLASQATLHLYMFVRTVQYFSKDPLLLGVYHIRLL